MTKWELLLKIAIIGSGVSGLVSAYLLSQKYEVTIFEKENRAGGHANTVLITDSEKKYNLDVGFIVYNEKTYPQFTKLLNELNISTQRSDMSFSFNSIKENFEFSSRGIRGFFAQKKNILNPIHYRMLYDLLAFHRDARSVLKKNELHNVTFEEYLENRKFSKAFKERLIVPLTAATWSNSPADILKFPTNYLFKFLEQHGVLAMNSIPEWRWIKEGAKTYIDAIINKIGKESFHFGNPVKGITRNPENVTVHVNNQEHNFDAVVLACHPDESLKILLDASNQESKILSGFQYAPNKVVLHDDTKMLPKKNWARASWNYQRAQLTDNNDTLTMTYYLNKLQSLDENRDFCVSVNPGPNLDPSRILASFDYSHLVYEPATLSYQQQLNSLNGKRNTYYVGAYLGYGFHEDGVASAVHTANNLGIIW
tara:strand:- start:542 stop:1816 length:1275 start_codon:yes stop_codon:yes gene_type:complete